MKAEGSDSIDVRVELLDKRFGETTAVDKVSFTARKGKFTTLLGPSGCGKTTTLRIVAGLERPDGGRVFLGDRQVCGNGGVWVPAEKRGIGMVFQSFAIWPHMTVLENVTFPLRYRGVSKRKREQKARDVLELVQLGDLLDRYPAQLSGGQQQRVSLARALVYDPVLLLLDEPMANLDAKLREEMRFEFRTLQNRTGVTTIYVTHDQSEAMVCSDQLVVMDQGRVVQVGSPLELYENPANEFVANFLGLANLLRGQVCSLASLNGIGKIKFSGGEELACCLPPNASLDDEMVVCIRPEYLQLSERNENTEGQSLECEVEEVAFLGENYDIRLKAKSLSLRARCKPRLGLKLGSLVHVYIRREDVKFVPSHITGTPETE